ncbi:unnamed protein product [Colletotrichum noveboracense]|uniref:FAD-binding PCMH-type domain-containing protein n=1 Tax=Colletotrichum noveboracense TaxID=2664923 RepID=A0A9W4S040_9PEZI|nr:hypothetical protein K456DRAFT_1749574 [Colletotrichum gloeosporioides 23]KAJ0269793.1 hypothetical protein COL940_012155 [Colletotrichum noveboracense]CAI0650511.1 unnamed protein product [Colletotrichum noveboracense]
MYRFKMEVLTAVAAWAIASSCANIPVARQFLGGICARDTAELGNKLSDTAKIYEPGSADFTNATIRWSNLNAPTVSLVVVPGTENDVAETIKFANEKSLPFLAYNGVHGAITTLGKMQNGIEIYLNQLSGVEVSEDGQSAKIAGGTRSKLVTDTLWEAGKQTVTGTCECVSTLGPALGGGHGWLQGHHGLVADQFLSMNIVLANGTLVTIDESSDLWWAVKGAGHNFGIVTSVNVKVYDIEHSNWAVETLIFSGEKVEEVYQAANDHLLKNGTQSADVVNWSYWLNNPDADAENPIILFWIIQEGVDVVDSTYTQPFLDIGPISTTPTAGTYLDLATWTGIDLDAIPCQKAGLNNPRFPIYVESYNVTAQRQAYDLFAANVKSDSPFYNSLFMFEGYSNEGVKAVDSDSTAFAFREDNLLFAPLITYTPNGTALDQQAADLGNQLRQIIHEGSGREQVHVYLNYAFGDETTSEWYGADQWRQDRLKSLKSKYDPEGKFSFYGPVA